MHTGPSAPSQFGRPGFSRESGLPWAGLLSALFLATAVSYRIDAALDPGAQRLSGAMRATVRNDTGAPLPDVLFWLWPNRLGEPPPGLDDVSFYWVYPRSFNAGWMRVHEVSVEGGAARTAVLDHEKAGKRTLLRVALPRPLAPGGRVEIALRFEVGIPSRYGSFGCAAGVCTLAQGWHPMVAAPGATGFRDDAMPARADYDVTVRSPWATVLGGRIASAVSLSDAAYLPLVAFEKLHALEVRHRGVRITYLGRFSPVPPSDKRIPYGLENFYVIGSEAAKKALDLLFDLGLPLPESVTLCEVPLRNPEITQGHAGLVLVSDHAWRLFPLERFRKFHTFQVARAIYGSWIEERAAGVEDPGDLAWAPDAAASFLVELLTLRQYGSVEFARDVLRYFSFLPDIDALIYAPKVAFSAAYFGSVEDPDPLRDDLRRFNNDLPRGKRVYEKLKDLLGGRRVVALMRAYLKSSVPFRKAAEQAAQRPLDDFFAQWLGPYPPVHYEIVAVESQASGSERIHHVLVRKHGAVVEPVTLWARDQGGREFDLRWDGRGATHDFTFRSPDTLDVVHLDPQERLVESWPGRNDDLRFDNRRPPRWKLLFYSFSALLDVVQLQPAFRIDFALLRKYDLSQSFRFGFFHSPIIDYGASVAYGRNFGEQVDPNRRSGGVDVGLSASRLNQDFARFAGREARPATRLGISAGLGYDDRLWLLDAHRGFAAGLNAGTSATLLDEEATLWNYSLGASATKVLRMRPGHVLAAQLGAGSVFGDIELPSQLIGVGGPNGMVGYETDELLGRAAATLTVEYRHMFVQGLDWNVLHLYRGRGFGGALFADAASLSSCDEVPGGWLGGDSYFFDAGYSLRGYFDYLGVSQAIIRADVGVPLNRHHHPCSIVDDPGMDGVLGTLDDPPPPSRSPFGIFISFAPPF
jgi:hypothetical protein